MDLPRHFSENHLCGARCSHRETNRSVRSRCGSAKPPRRDTVAEPMESQKADSSVVCGSTKERKDATATPPACRYLHRVSEAKPSCTVDTEPRNLEPRICQSSHAVKCIIHNAVRRTPYVHRNHNRLLRFGHPKLSKVSPMSGNVFASSLVHSLSGPNSVDREQRKSRPASTTDAPYCQEWCACQK